MPRLVAKKIFKLGDAKKSRGDGKGSKQVDKKGAKKAGQMTLQKAGAKKVAKKAGQMTLQKVKKAGQMTLQQWNALQVGMDDKWPLPGYMNGMKGHTAYHEETYGIVTHWASDTRISYRPHAKRPGSKSHVRYEQYSQAKTVGEALKFGTLPADWCWDYERGFIKVHGPVRDEPVDLCKLDEGTETPVDMAIHRWYKRELARNLGLNVKDLGKDMAYNESLVMRAHRLVTQREAKAILEEADKKQTFIMDADVELILQKWHFAKNPWRVNVMEEGQKWVFSDTLGLNRDRIGDIHLTAATKRYPQVTELFSRWLNERLPPDMKTFSWTSLNVNYDYAARIHRDNGNFGPSMIKAFGKFEGGGLNYWPEDNKTLQLDKLPAAGKVNMQIRDGLAVFNGNCAHSVDDFKGHRYSIVFFTLGCHADAPEDAKEQLRTLGVPYPTADADPHRLLRQPSGKHTAAAISAKSNEKSSYKYWKTSVLKPHRCLGSSTRLAPANAPGRVLRGGWNKGGGFKGLKKTLKK